MLEIQIEPLGKLQVTRKGDGWALNDVAQSATVEALDDYTYTVTRNGRTFRVLMLGYDAEKQMLKLSINGKRAVLPVQTAENRLLTLIGKAGSKNRKLAELRAPMPGLIRRIAVETGSVVEAQTPLLVLEAMKMENVLRASAAATIQEIVVKEGQAVEKNALLIRFA